MAKQELHECMLMGELVDGKAQAQQHAPVPTPSRTDVLPPPPTAFAAAACGASAAAADIGGPKIRQPAQEPPVAQEAP